MKKIVILLINISIAGLLFGQNVVQPKATNSRTTNFPKQNVPVGKMPAKHNLWVFMLAGQSNMAGRGFVEPGDTLPNSRIITISKNNKWILAKEPLNFYQPNLTGLDCGLSFGKELIKYIPDSVSIALIPCAVGGSSVQQWLGDSIHQKVQLLSNFKNKLDLAKQHGVIKGILWHQGESDGSPELIPKYKKGLEELIAVFRDESGNDNLPFLIGELGTFANAERQLHWNSINKIIHEVAFNDENTFVIGTDDLENKGDNVHFNSAAQRSMGWRFARIFTGYFIDGRYTYKAKRTGKICTVEKQLLIPSPDSITATKMNIHYIGTGLKQSEYRANISSSDWTDTHRKRYSSDNGKTWTNWQPVFKKAPEQNGFVLSGDFAQDDRATFDPASGMLIKPAFQRILMGDPTKALSAVWMGDRKFFDHGFYQFSSDNGESWDEGHLLKYESGPDFDPENWGNPKYLRTNEMYIGGITIHSKGNVIIAATVPVPFRNEEDEKIPVVFPNTYREGCVAGAICFVGKWNAELKDYSWQISNSIFLPRKISTRGLVEIDISELKDGRLLLIMRGSNVGLDPMECPGRKWYSLSEDGGLTWSEIKDLRYDTGEQFYSPATFAKTIRSTATGKLYCVLNINTTPPLGNGPRYPLQIVEIDEDKVCLKKETVTIIDELNPGLDSKHLQLSNFGLFENRENKTIELYLTRLGERGGGAKIWDSDTYRYVISFFDE